MNTREIRELTAAELHNRLEDAHRELFNLRFQKAVRQLSNPRRMAEVRHDIARMLTVVRERELYEAAQAASEQEGTAGGR